MSQPITITVHGQPAPQGSKRAFAVRGKGGVPTGRIAVIESSHDRVKSWRQAVIDAALAAVGDRELPLDGPLKLGIVFALPRPKGHYGTGRNAARLRDSAPNWPTSTPDLSKLLRATEDALTDAGIWRDDAQVVGYVKLEKIYAGSYGPTILPVPGASIVVQPLPAQLASVEQRKQVGVEQERAARVTRTPSRARV
jgi:Holliday junction resolvase RusA-like endonuclease